MEFLICLIVAFVFVWALDFSYSILKGDNNND